MNHFKRICTGLQAGSLAMLATLGAVTTALADDTEIFVSQPVTAASAPNIMFIMDTSGSMSTSVNSAATFDPAFNYVANGTGNCSGLSDRVYYTTGTSPPSCSSDQWFPIANLGCTAAATQLANGGTGSFGPDNLVRWSGSNGSRRWRRSNFDSSNPTTVDCQSDEANGSPFPKAQAFLTNPEKSSNAGVYTTVAAQSYWANGPSLQLYRLYNAQFVVYWQQFRSLSLGTRMSVMQQAATQMLSGLTGVNAGLMRYSNNGGSGEFLASGGYVIEPVAPIENNRASLIATVNGFSPGGYTPLSETLFEAYRYFSGGPVQFGNNSSPALSVASSRNPPNAGGANYESPADYSCQKNYVVYMTDGLPTADSEANAAIQSLPNFGSGANQWGQACLAAGSGPDTNWSNSGLCLAALSNYMYEADLRGQSGDPQGVQNVKSYYIGLGSDFVSGGQLNAAFTYLSDAATAGGGQAYQANDVSDLSTILAEITNEINDDAQSFAAPTVGVNAFNRTRNLDELYVSLFKPTGNSHWPGNLKKYRLAGGQLVDDNGAAAVDSSTGTFFDTTQELWSTTPDGTDVQLGGAANQIPDPATRRLYTYLDVNQQPASPVDLTSNNYAISTSNGLINNDAILGTGGPGDPTSTQLVEWVRGVDVQDEDTDGNTTEARRKSMGDPLHSQPSVVVYGSGGDLNDAVVYTATNDGFLHAFDVTDGHELWAFVPAELLDGLLEIYNDNQVNTRRYGLDGDIRVEKFDVNGNGIVDGNDRVLLYFGMGRGGSNYYALDVTNKAQPHFVWSLSSANMPGIGQTWSAPVLANVHITTPVSTQNSQRLVLIMGGGYDPTEDGSDITGPYVTSNSIGNRIFIVDAITGARLWSAGPTGSGASLELARMDHAIPGGISVIDLNSDGYADRLYAGDMAGQVWRFDIHNGQNTANLVTGGVLASLGTHDDNPHTIANARRFYSTPDISLITPRGSAPYLNIAIGSGYRGHPLNTGIQDRFYALRDFNIANKLTQAEYDALTVVHDGDMTDITTANPPVVAPSAPGWKLLMNQHGGWVGEKVMGASVTLNGTVLFTTYTPTGYDPNSPCLPSGINRAYAISVTDGSATVDINNDGAVDSSDRSMAVASGSIISGVTVLMMGDGRIPTFGPPQSCTAGDPNCTCDANNQNCTTDPPPSCQAGEPNCTCDANNQNCRPTNPDTVCTAGITGIPVCTQINRLRKTFWMENAAN